MSQEITPDFTNQGGLLPCIVQDSYSGSVLMLGFMNQEAYDHTRATGRVTFFSRTRKRLWTKGETSGHFLQVENVKIDCDRDTLLVLARPTGPVCHTGSETCFGPLEDFRTLAFLENIISDRFENRKKDSYTSSLFEKGINAIAQKVGEEAVELVIESKDNDDEKFIGEAADLLFHVLVLLRARDQSLSDVIRVLNSRHKRG